MHKWTNFIAIPGTLNFIVNKFFGKYTEVVNEKLNHM